MGRNTQGVRLITLKGNQSIAAVAAVEKDDETEEELSGEEGNIEGSTDAAVESPTEE
jgi:DNA gyrase subunit A